MNAPSGTGDWRGELAVTGLGLVTPVGLYAEAALAALRAGVSRLSMLEHCQIEVDEDEFGPATGAEVPRLPRGRLGTARLERLMKPAFEEVVRDAGVESSNKLGVFLGTAGARPGERLLSYTGDAKELVLEAIPKGLNVRLAKLVPVGRAAVLQAVREAAAALEAGSIDVAIVGATDSWVTPRALAWLREQGKLPEFPRRTGTIPGEAAGFVALEKPERARSRSARVYAHVVAAAGRHETVKWGEPNNAIALSQALQATVAGVEEPHAVVFSDHSGERYRAQEWLMALPKGMWTYSTMEHRCQADCIGDTGAASGAVAIAWAASGLRKGYLRSNHALVWGASDEGARETVLLRAAGGHA